HLVVGLPVELHRVREVVVVRPRDGVARLHLDRPRREAVALRHLDLRRRDRLARARAAAARRDEGRGEDCDGWKEEPEPHAEVPRAGLRTVSYTAPAKTRTNAVRSSTSAIVCANRNTVQSRW